MENKPKTITKAEDVLQQLENIRFYIQTEEQAGNALVFAKKLKEFSQAVEEKVKKRASEIMMEEDLKEIDTGDFLIKKVDPTITSEYDAGKIIDILGIDRAKALGLKVSTSKLESYIKKRGVSDEELKEISERGAVKKKPRKGYIAIKQKKDE